MHLKALTITLSLLCILALAPTGHALQVTQNTYEDAFPSLKGNLLVWQGKIDGDWEIFVYDTVTQQTSRLTDNDYNDIAPQTDGNYITWLGYSNKGGDIFVYKISTQAAIKIRMDTTKTYVNAPPQIASGRTVWTSHEVTESVEPGDVFLYDANTDLLNCLSDAVDADGTLDDNSPRINGEHVSWVQSGAERTTRFLYSVTDETISRMGDGFVWNDNPEKDGFLHVFTAHDGTDREVFVKNTSTNTVEQITNNTVEDYLPRISGTEVAWVQSYGINSEIHLSKGPGRCLSVDLDQDGDVDGADLAKMLIFPDPSRFKAFAEKFGMTQCR